MAYQVARVAAEYVMIRVAVHVRADAEDGVYRAVKRAVLGWRQKDPTTPIYGPDGRPVEEWLADQEERHGE
jgi:hypothetical protein